MDDCADLLIVGAGLGGLAAALACARQAPRLGRIVLAEQAGALQEVGAGIQCGPNMTRRWQRWGLMPALREQAHAPGAVVARDAASGRELGRLDTRDFEARYGAPYLTVHRADLQAALAAGVAQHGAQVQLLLGMAMSTVDIRDGAVQATGPASARTVSARLLIGADGLHSVVRGRFWPETQVPDTGELAWRGMVAMRELPARLRRAEVQAWLGPRMHVVSYPVRGGEWLNVAAFSESHTLIDARAKPHSGAWLGEGLLADLLQATGPMCAELAETLAALPGLRRWRVHARAPLQSAADLHHGADSPVALLGDAAHPMQPYLAQGAGMALEDADALAQALSTHGTRPQALAAYARTRWQRNAQVQTRAARNGRVFHAAGPLRLARNLALSLRPQLMDQPWLYGY